MPEKPSEEMRKIAKDAREELHHKAAIQPYTVHRDPKSQVEIDSQRAKQIAQELKSKQKQERE